MTSKKKSLTSQNNIVEMLEGRLKDMEKVLEGLLNIQIKELEIRQKESEDKIAMLTKQVDRSIDNAEGVRCNDNHLKDKNQTQKRCFSCNICDKGFNSSYHLEKHMEEHNYIKSFKCDECDKKFFVEWRLKKHVNGHKNTNRKFCHYFNNAQHCPYEESGCKFVHETSRMCLFGNECRHYLCQYSHKAEVINNEDNSVKFNEKNDNGSEERVDQKDAIDKLKEAYEKIRVLEANKEETDKKVESAELKEAHAKIRELEANREEMQKKIKLYSSAIHKLRTSRNI